MANLPLSVSVNWKALVLGLLVFACVLYYFSGVIWKPKSPSVKSMLKSGYIKVGDEQEAIFYRHILPETVHTTTSVLFLHGQVFSSKTWEDIGTLQFLGKKGYRVMAIDLPSYGNSKMELPKTPKERAHFLDLLIKQLELSRPVLVAPSMSGSFALPFIFEGENANKLRGFVPVAPVSTEKYAVEKYKNLALRTMIVYGQNDHNLGEKSLERLKNIPNSEIKRIDGAGHACYMNNTGEFHSYLEEFLKKLEKS